MTTCVRCGNAKPEKAFKLNRRGGGRRSTCRTCNKTRARRLKGRPIRDPAASARRQRNQAMRTLRRLLNALLTGNCERAGVSVATVRYRARYRLDPTFRAREIVRRHLRDYPVEDDGTLTPEYVRDLFARATHCPYCGKPMHPRAKTLDHVVPRSRGGKHSAGNVRVCCLSCNSRKGARDYVTTGAVRHPPYPLTSPVDSTPLARVSR